jgi:hypothetical protein
MQVGDDFHLGINLITKPGEPLISGGISLILIDGGKGVIVTGFRKEMLGSVSMTVVKSKKQFLMAHGSPKRIGKVR